MKRQEGNEGVECVAVTVAGAPDEGVMTADLDSPADAAVANPDPSAGTAIAGPDRIAAVVAADTDLTAGASVADEDRTAEAPIADPALSAAASIADPGPTAAASIADPGPTAAAHPIRKSAFAAVIAVQFCSLLGQEMLQFVLPLHLLMETGSGTLFGITVACGFIPATLLAPVGGVMADRLSKRRVVMAVDVVLALAMALFVVSAEAVSSVPAIVGAVVASFMAQAIFQPTIQSTVPFALPSQEVPRGVAMVSQVGMITTLAGPVAGAVLYGAWGLAPVALACALAFAGAAGVAALFMRLEEPVRVCSDVRAGVLATVRSDVAEAAGFLRARPTFIGYIAVATFINLFGGAFIVTGIPYIVTITLGMGSTYTSIAQGALGVGGLIGGSLMAVWPHAFPASRAPRYMACAAAAIGLLAGALALQGALPAAAVFTALVASVGVVMAACSLVSVMILGALQAETPHTLQGKVIALFMSCANVAMPLGQLVCGIAFDHVPAALIAAAAAMAVLAVAASWAAWVRRRPA